VIGGSDSGETTANELGDTEGGSRDRGPAASEEGGGGGTNSIEAEGGSITDSAGGGDAGSAGANDSDTRSSNDAETTMEVAAPTQDGTDPQVAAFKAGKSKFGVAAGYRGQR
jgi:hypothetical protein